MAIVINGHIAKRRESVSVRDPKSAIVQRLQLGRADRRRSVSTLTYERGGTLGVRRSAPMLDLIVPFCVGVGASATTVLYLKYQLNARTSQ